MTQYRALVGIDYPPNKRAEEGDIVSDLPSTSIAWLLAGGLIEPLDGKPVKKAEAKPAKIIEFNPDAKDGDGDGLVQDGTIHERPALKDGE